MEFRLDKWQEAGRIGAETLEYAKRIIKPGKSLLEIVEELEAFVEKRNAKLAFPINLSINEVAAHSTPLQEEGIARDLLKVDVGINVEGYISDCACTLDLTKEKKYKNLIEASEKALEEAIKIIKEGVELREIGKKIQQTISSYGFSPVINLSGHELKPWKLHAGLTVPNYDNNDKTKIKKNMILAIEPFATLGSGIVQEGKESGIYKLKEKRNVRDPLARKILDFIYNNYKELPFSSRWIVKLFGQRALFSLRILEEAGCLHQFRQLVEKTRAPVSQAEVTLVVLEDSCEVLTKI